MSWRFREEKFAKPDLCRLLNHLQDLGSPFILESYCNPPNLDDGIACAKDSIRHGLCLVLYHHQDLGRFLEPRVSLDITKVLDAANYCVILLILLYNRT